MDLAVGALSGLVDALPAKLGELLQEEYSLLSGVRGDVGFLQSELSTMHAALLRCEALDDPDTQTRVWVAQVRDLAYDTEDWVDLFAHRVDGGGGHDAAGGGGGAADASSSGITRWLRCCVNKVRTMPARHVIANELQELKARVYELSEQRKRYRFEPPTGHAAAMRLASFDPRLTTLYADASGFVGLDAPVEEVVTMVTDAEVTELKVVSMVGMPGSGKTTIASAVHRHLGVQDHFQFRAFVSVGQKPDAVKKTLKDMLTQLGDEFRGNLDTTHLINRLREVLNDKRYLIVLDDLWSKEHWNTIQCCFQRSNTNGGRIIVTTRNEGLAKECSNSGGCVYKIGVLGDSESRELFFSRAFGRGSECPDHLKNVYDKIMGRCGGLPLAIACVAGALAHRSSTDELEMFASNLLVVTHSDSLNLKKILNLSYNDLPPHLKTCMLYLSIFPSNHEINTERLVRRWVAEGFIGATRHESAEETAKRYLMELISRNMIKPLHLQHDDIPRSCTLHPVIHDFIVVKSMEENFVTCIDAQHKAPLTNNTTIRRLSLQNSSKPGQEVKQNDSMKHARSMTVFGDASGAPRLTDMSVLRVLDFEGSKGLVCLDGLCKLVLLRYLSLRGTDAIELPAQIGDLTCLETLDVRSTKVKVVPLSILRFRRLMHLLAGNAKLPSGIRSMKTLQTLSCASVGTNSASVVQELSELGNLRELELFCDATEFSFPSNGFTNLKQLCIQCTLPSVTFVTDSLPKVQVLELKFEKGRPDESSGVSGIEHLPRLKHVLVEFSQHDAGAAATVASVRNTAETVHPNRPDVSAKPDVMTN